MKPEVKYSVENDPEMMRYWMKQGPKTAAFLLVIPGATIIGYGLGLSLGNPLSATIVGLGAGLVLWGLVVALKRV